MNSKTAKGVIIGKWGLKSGSSRLESDLEKCKQENAALRKSLEEITKGKGRAEDPERSRLLEKILCLEKEKEKCNHLLGEKDKEIQNLRDRLKSKNKNSEVSLLHSQLEGKTKEAERREQLLSSLSEEMNQLKCNVSTITAKCSEIENRTGSSQASQETVINSPGSSANLSEVEKQLKDALEKNQQWLLYDQQREAYVRGLLGRILELEQRSEIVSQQQPKESNAEGHLQEKQKHYDHLLENAKSDLEAERCTVTRLKCELNELKKKYEQRQQEIMSLNALLRSQHVLEMKDQENENRMKGEKIQILKQENESVKVQLREEKKKSEDLLSQVERYQVHLTTEKQCVDKGCNGTSTITVLETTMVETNDKSSATHYRAQKVPREVQLLRKSLLKQQEEHARIALLEQQIQTCTADLENEKLDRQNLKHQLNKIFQELFKAREQITRLEPLKLLESGHMEPQEDLQAAFEEKIAAYDSSPFRKHSNILDESFLECPRCKVQYPTSQHRELLAHIDFCTA